MGSLHNPATETSFNQIVLCTHKAWKMCKFLPVAAQLNLQWCHEWRTAYTAFWEFAWHQSCLETCLLPQKTVSPRRSPHAPKRTPYRRPSYNLHHTARVWFCTYENSNSDCPKTLCVWGSSRQNIWGQTPIKSASAEWGMGWSMGRDVPPQPTRGDGRTSWAPPARSGAEPRPETHFGVFWRPQNTPFLHLYADAFEFIKQCFMSHWGTRPRFAPCPLPQRRNIPGAHLQIKLTNISLKCTVVIWP